METGGHRRCYLITIPRSASNLLVRILALDKQNVVSKGIGWGYFFFPAWELTCKLNTLGKHADKWTQEERDQVKKSYQDCFNDLQSHADRAEAEGKILFVKEHACFMADPAVQARFLHGQDNVKESPWTVQIPSTYAQEPTHSSLNPTILPDEFLKTWLPTFLVRHPALVFPSRYRALVDVRHTLSIMTEEEELVQLELAMTYHWTRTLFDWYTQQLSQTDQAASDSNDVAWPLVLDADDIISNPQVVVRFCEILGLDPAKLQFEWAPATAEDLAYLPSDLTRRAISTLSASASILRDKTAANLDIDVEARKWQEEFGNGMGEKMERWVRAAMPDYEFMRAKRLRVEPN